MRSNMEKNQNFLKLALMLLDHPDGILNYCRTKVPLGVKAANGNINASLLREP